MAATMLGTLDETAAPHRVVACVGKFLDNWESNRRDRINDAIAGRNDRIRQVALTCIGGYYPAMSWHVMLAGDGNFPASERLP